MSEYLQNLKEAVAAMHGCDCSHSGTSKYIDRSEGVFIDLEVEEFDLVGHAQASRAFAWAWDDDGEIRYIAILNVPPINSPAEAVMAAIASGQYK